jgi:hypothetical protein
VFNQMSYRDKKVVGVFVRFRAPLHWCINGLLDNFLQAGVISWTDNRFAQFYRFSCAIFQMVLDFSLRHVAVVFYIVFKFSYQIIWFALSLLPGVGCGNNVVMLLFMHWAISFHYGSTKTVKYLSTPKFSFASKRYSPKALRSLRFMVCSHN